MFFTVTLFTPLGVIETTGCDVDRADENIFVFINTIGKKVVFLGSYIITEE